MYTSDLEEKRMHHGKVVIHLLVIMWSAGLRIGSVRALGLPSKTYRTSTGHWLWCVWDSTKWVDLETLANRVLLMKHVGFQVGLNKVSEYEAGSGLHASFCSELSLFITLHSNKDHNIHHIRIQSIWNVDMWCHHLWAQLDTTSLTLLRHQDNIKQKKHVKPAKCRGSGGLEGKKFSKRK